MEMKLLSIIRRNSNLSKIVDALSMSATVHKYENEYLKCKEAAQ